METVEGANKASASDASTVMVERPSPMVAAHGGEGSPEIGGPSFDKRYREWRAGRVQDEAILNVSGEDWLFFYKVSRDGIEGDTLGGEQAPEDRDVWPAGQLVGPGGAGEATIVDVTDDAGQLVENGDDKGQLVQTGDEYKKGSE